MIPFTVARRVRSPFRLRILSALLLCIFVPLSFASAQLINGRFIGSLYSWQKYDTVNVSKKLTRGFASALFDIAQGDFSIHTHFQMASMLQRKLDEEPDYRLFYLYAQWKNILDMVDISVGRIPYFHGVGNGTIDGGLATLLFFDKSLRLTAYGGANVPLSLAAQDWGPLKKDYTVGGQIVTTAIKDARLGVSYTNKVRSRPAYWALRADSLFNPTLQFIEPEPLKEQLFGGDGSYWMGKLYFYGRYVYDIDNKRTQRGQAGVRYYSSDKLSISADYIHRAPRVMFNSFFTVFNFSNTDEIEAGVDYVFAPSIRGFLRGGYVEYIDDKSFRYTVGLAYDYVSLTYRGGDGYAGKLNSVSLQATYPFLENSVMPTAGVSYYSYKLNAEAPRENAFAGTLGAVVRPLQALSVDVQGQWLTNKIVKRDFRLFAKLNYWFTQRLNIFE